MDEKLGKYRLLSLLATGGMGEVFLARLEGRAGFSKTVVLKRILRHLANDQGFIDMFRNEALLAAQLQHPNIVQIFELDREDDTWFIAMEYVHGRSLRACLQQAQSHGTKFPPRLAARICAQALQGLHFAHRLTDERSKPLGILHRDVSPDNVLVSFAGEVKLVDFGIAKAMTGNLMTRTGRLKGKYPYMAPEQFNSGGIIDARLDVYAMGVLLHELLTNELPASVPRTADDAVKPREGYQARTDVPEPLQLVLQRALEPDPRDRFESGEAFAAALESFVQSTGEPVMGGHVSKFLSDLFGPEVVAANPAVAPLQSSAPGNRTAVLGSGTAGTAVLSPHDGLGSGPTSQLYVVGGAPATDVMYPVARVRPSQPRPVVPVPAEVKGPPPEQGRAQRWWPWLALALLAVAVVGAVGLVSSQLPEPEPVPPPEPVAAAPKPGPGNKKPKKVAMADALPPVPAPAIDAGPSPAELQRIAAEAEAAKLRAEKELAEAEAETAQAKAEKERAEAEAAKAKAAAEKLLRKKQPAAPKSGRVVVRANPWAEVFFNGKSYGVTPLRGSIEVPSGKAAFVLKNSQLGVTRSFSVRVPPGETVTLKADMTKR